MSKKKARLKQTASQPKRKSRQLKPLVVVGLILCLGLTSLILAQWRSTRSSLSTTSPLPQSSPSLSLSKEYIYAGGRLVATEEPASGGGSSPLSAPSSLIATATSGTQITLNWTASTGGTVDHYQVERCQSFGSNCYSIVEANVPISTPTINYSDTTVTAGSAYLYRVRAVDSSGNYSGYSSIDLATALTFTDDPLNPNGTKTTIKAQHLTELRQAVNAVRALAGLGAATWTDSSPAGVAIKAAHIQELRTNLDQALSALGLSAVSYTDPTLTVGTTLIKKAHFEELRQAVK